MKIKVPQKGEKIRLVEMAENNAKISLDNKEKAHKNIIVEMKDTLKLDRLPRKIESYDISNISGQYMVAGMCVMIDGMIKKNLARRFRIKTVFGQDDPRCMEEVITRRLRHSIDLNKIETEELLETKVAEDNEEYGYSENQWKDRKRKTESIEQKLEESRKPLVTIRDRNKFDNLSEEIKEKYSEDKGFGRLPDLILADGGITQIRATLQAIKNIENEIGVKIGIRVFGMVKNDKHQTRALMDEYRQEVEISEEKSEESKKMKVIDLSERQRQILTYMDAGVEYSTEQVAEKIGLKGPRTRQLLNELVNMELLACIGTTKRRRYIKV